MSSKVKQANFRLPLDYMSMIDDFARREDITKAAVITRALDCMQASYDAGNGGMPITSAGSGSGVSEQELEDLRKQLKEAQDRAESAERRANDAIMARDAAEKRAAELVAENAKANLAASIPVVTPVDNTNSDELERLRALVAKQEASIEEKNRALAAKDATIAERDARITSLTEQLGAANAKAQFINPTAAVNALPVDGGGSPGEDPTRALSLLNMLGGVMGAFQQQVDDARQVGEQEGRSAVQREFEDMINRARNDGYREAMTYLDDRVTTAREAGAKEERARIANMGFFERRRYLKVHLT